MTSSAEEQAPFAMDTPKHARVAGVTPKDAASLILIDRSNEAPRVLMGRRGSGHVFMPDVYVFPGGKRDARDHALPSAPTSTRAFSKSWLPAPPPA